MFFDVKVLIWDFDGTLYKSMPELWKEIREAEYRTIMDHTGWARERAVEEFTKAHKVIPSATTTVAALSGITTPQAALYGERYIDRKKYLRRDEKLIALFKKLRHLVHYMLVNGVKKSTLENLIILGLSPDQFADIITSEMVGENKPSEKGFRHILEKTGLPAYQHLMIGDREAVDLVPAKNLGMKTCLVWTETTSAVADCFLPTVYDLDTVLL